MSNWEKENAPNILVEYGEEFDAENSSSLKLLLNRFKPVPRGFGNS